METFEKVLMVEFGCQIGSLPAIIQKSLTYGFLMRSLQKRSEKVPSYNLPLRLHSFLQQNNFAQHAIALSHNMPMRQATSLKSSSFVRWRLCLRDGVLREDALARWHVVRSLKRENFETHSWNNYRQCKVDTYNNTALDHKAFWVAVSALLDQNQRPKRKCNFTKHGCKTSASYFSLLHVQCTSIHHS